LDLVQRRIPYCTQCNGALVNLRTRQIHSYRYGLLSVENLEEQTQETSGSLSADIEMDEQDNEQENDENQQIEPQLNEDQI